jgi:hypothetical protein
MNKRLNGQKVHATELSQVCHHVSAGRISAPKRCMLNHECFHCGYDQWLDAIDLEKMQPGLMAGALKRNLAKAA